MDITALLQELGLSEGEVRVYLALLKRGETTVAVLTKETGQHRTTIYDFLDHLTEKGLVSYHIERGVRHYHATDPEQLLIVLKEREERLRMAIPKLRALSLEAEPELELEVFRGVEGFRAILLDYLSVGEPMYAFGVDERKYKEVYGRLMEWFFREEQRRGLKEYILTSEKVKFQFRFKHLHYRSLPAEYFDPHSTVVYGDRVLHSLWEPISTIRIKNQGLADAYRRHFRMLWKLAKSR